MLTLFTKLVTPILVYGAEIWGYEYCKQIESLQARFCKRIIGLSSKSSNAAALGECGMFSLSCIYFVRCIKYWLKLLSMDNCRYPKQCCLMLKQLDDVNRVTWVTKVRILLYSYGFGYVWMQQGVGNIDVFVQVFKQRVKDCSMQTWLSDVNENKKFDLYKCIKSELQCEKYLLWITSSSLRSAMSKFRCSDHKLRIETGRHEGLARDLRVCRHCLTVGNEYVDDEYHFLMICVEFDDIRAKYLPKLFVNNPSRQNFIELIKTENCNIINNIALFINFANRKRSEYNDTLIK